MSFGGGYSPPSPYKTKTQEVTKWRRQIGVQSGEGGDTIQYEYRDQAPTEGDTGWESYTETINVRDTSEDTTEETAEEKAAAETAAQNEAELARKKKGRRSTILTGGQGVSYSPMLGKSYLTGKTALGQ